MSTLTPSVVEAIPLAYRPAQAAKVIGIGRAKLYELLAAGEIPARKLGASTLILHDDLAAYLASLPLAGGTDAA